VLKRRHFWWISETSFFIYGLIMQFTSTEGQLEMISSIYSWKIFVRLTFLDVMSNKTKLFLQFVCFYNGLPISLFFLCLNIKVCFDRLLTQLIAYLFSVLYSIVDALQILKENWFSTDIGKLILILRLIKLKKLKITLRFALQSKFKSQIIAQKFLNSSFRQKRTLEVRVLF